MQPTECRAKNGLKNGALWFVVGERATISKRAVLGYRLFLWVSVYNKFFIFHWNWLKPITVKFRYSYHSFYLVLDIAE